MADITVQNLTKYYGDRLILKDISFDIQPGEKVAVLGANGAGKTTLLNILTGRLPYDGGHVGFGQGRTAGVIDQMPDFPPECTVEDILRLAFKESDEVAAAMDELTDEMTRKPDDASLLKRYAQLETRLESLGGYNRDYEINRVCNGLEIPQEMRAQKFSLLSGGEKTRINLARIILEQTDVLLLDEPTNHLDMDAVDWLGNYLESYHGTVLIISHDRWFIDQCCDRVIEIHDCTCDFYNGNYSYYAVERERRREEQLKHHEHELAEKKRLEATARSMHEHGTEHLAKRAASIEKRIARMKVTDRPKTDKKMSVTFGDPNYETEEVLKVRVMTDEKYYRMYPLTSATASASRCSARTAQARPRCSKSCSARKRRTAAPSARASASSRLTCRSRFTSPTRTATSSTRSSTTRTFPCRSRETVSARFSSPARPR